MGNAISALPLTTEFQSYKRDQSGLALGLLISQSIELLVLCEGFSPRSLRSLPQLKYYGDYYEVTQLTNKYIIADVQLKIVGSLRKYYKPLNCAYFPGGGNMFINYTISIDYSRYNFGNNFELVISHVQAAKTAVYRRPINNCCADSL